MQRKTLKLNVLRLPGKIHCFGFLFLLFQCCIYTCFAQAPQTRVNIQLLGPEQGLPSRNTRSLAQDGRGFMWMGTGQDLWRYDGYTFQNFTDILTRSIGGRTLINQIRTGPKGNIWVTHNSGISIIDPVSLKCTTIDPARNWKGIDSKQNLDIFFDKEQNGWVAIPRGKLIKLGKDNLPVSLYTPPADSAQGPAIGSQVTQFFVDGQNNRYALNDSSFLDKISEEAKLIHRVNLLNKDLITKNFRVFSVVQFSMDTLTIYYEHRSSRKIRTRKYSFNNQEFGSLRDADTPLAPYSIYPDKKGHTWYKSSEKIGLLNNKTGVFTDLTARLQQKSGASIYFFAAMLSADDSFWISCMDGLFKITLTEEVFKKYLSITQEKPGDIGSSIRGITEDSSGMIWVCSYGFYRDGIPYLLHQINPKTGLSRHMVLHRPKNIPGDNVIPYKVLFTKNEVYAVTDGTQFIKIDPETELYYPVEFPFVSGRGFTSFYKLNDRKFWLGTWGGMATIDTRDMKPVLLNDRVGPYVKNVRVNNFMTWAHNCVLVSTTNGLYVLNQDATIHEHYGQDAKDKIRLPASEIFHTVWHENALWAGSAKGLIRIDTIRKKAQLFTTQDGLPDNNIYAALPDARGNLWLSTNKGLSRFNTRTQKFHNYGIADGLPHMEFNHGSYLKTKDGTLYFGGLNGIVAFNPNELDLSEKKESVLRLISFSKYAADRNQTDTVTTHQPGQKIVFNPSDRLFAFAFMSPDYENTALNRFRYKLEGWDDDRWHMFENGNKLLFNSLPAGTYNLKVQVSVAGADWSNNEWQAPIRVMAPWYKSPWFFVLSIAFVVIVLYLFYQYQLRQVLHIQQIRNGISADMHDEIGSTLSSITFYSQALLMQIEKAEHQQVVQKIKENAQQVQEGLSDIVWSVKAGSDEIEDVFARMFHFGSALAESKGFAFQFDTDAQLANVKLDMQTRKNLYLIFKEAVNNAAKYAQCTTVEVQTKFEMGKTKMVIKDDGKGFDRATAKKGNGLTNMQQRAAQMKGQLLIQSAKDVGTIVTLTF
ncbi:two-component regulator propeller domain-containing protein [Dyadobacter sp. CY326]|uniref:ligand-binding sensor domain-containing protein n=1 Tax=Dyadobacter sp. CY326 TaxID=2907300 RepID=UPI001F437B22|nr:sensor histidine kinase [Dyadobacter sp. CY326]MCE7065043.1 histidine kinase [Dyadobacter sp. CY326]